jgi:hypothetical protein
MRTPLSLLGRSVLVLSGTLLGLSACGPEFDPLYREGLYRPQHDNHMNLVTQVANPADLVRGTGTSVSDGQLAAAAVDRLRTDKVKKLPQTDVADIGSGANETQGSSGATP